MATIEASEQLWLAAFHLIDVQMKVELQKNKPNKTLTCPAQQVMFWAESLQCNSPLFNGVAGEVEIPAGQVNFSSVLSLPRLASNVLEPMLHPEIYIYLLRKCI